jgi:hypothetical protein
MIEYFQWQRKDIGLIETEENCDRQNLELRTEPLVSINISFTVNDMY